MVLRLQKYTCIIIVLQNYDDEYSWYALRWMKNFSIIIDINDADDPAT